ncbi:unnamed protein product [Cuscuta campestris]|uniref:Uncharacterized protein n=1 Tax=Cuscuta campestris TaxID=132261 RepID=A0A484KLX3_9ASTE|nr:unnamed protein product [Cuscuta campestris]
MPKLQVSIVSPNWQEDLTSAHFKGLFDPDNAEQRRSGLKGAPICPHSNLSSGSCSKIAGLKDTINKPKFSKNREAGVGRASASTLPLRLGRPTGLAALVTSFHGRQARMILKADFESILDFRVLRGALNHRHGPDVGLWRLSRACSSGTAEWEDAPGLIRPPVEVFEVAADRPHKPIISTSSIMNW